MQILLLAIGRLAALSGVLVCALAGGARLAGAYWLGGFQVTTLLQVGIAAMVLGCLCFLIVLLERLGDRDP